MELLYDETYASDDGLRKSRNIWYGSADITAQGEYGTVVKLDGGLIDSLCEKIADDLAENAKDSPAETNWYFYGSGVTKESVGGSILPAIMVRERSGAFAVNISISDHDFALNLDAVLSFKADFEGRLAGSL